jgi:hypothetical protein
MSRRDIVVFLGGEVAWPLALRAQPQVPMVGVVRPNPKDVLKVFAAPFRRYMRAIGWEGDATFASFRSALRPNQIFVFTRPRTLNGHKQEYFAAMHTGNPRRPIMC